MKVDSIIKKLQQEYPDSKCSLNFKDHFELLIATMLSAQCTDAKVNQVTPELFQNYPNPEKLAKSDLKDIERILKRLGLYKNKAKNIRATATMVFEKHQSQVPDNREALTAMPGVGRKTANVVLGIGFGVPALVVDTHVKRISNRLGLTESQDPNKIEQDLMPQVSEKYWSQLAHLFIDHGRKICKAAGPVCEECCLRAFCEYPDK